jgi:DNA-binding NarL/FixJ family response regulator
VIVDLTPREAEIARLIHEGLGYGEIAHVLGIQRGTVRVFVVKIARRLPPAAGSAYQRIVWWMARQEAA